VASVMSVPIQNPEAVMGVDSISATSTTIPIRTMRIYRTAVKGAQREKLHSIPNRNIRHGYTTNLPIQAGQNGANSNPQSELGGVPRMGNLISKLVDELVCSECGCPTKVVGFRAVHQSAADEVRCQKTQAEAEPVAETSVSSPERELEFPHSTCVECGKKIPSGDMQKCEFGSYCSWRVPKAVRDFISYRSRLSREESATQPTESAAAIVKALRKAVKAIEELYSTERGVYQHSEECRAVHAFLSEARSALAPYSAPKGGN